jgi:hypothetical protein
MSHSTARLLWRLGIALALLAISSACGSSGCQGCTPTPIPGGFPAKHRFDNAMQVRLSNNGIGFVAQHFTSLVNMLVPTGMSFDIPPTGCSSGNNKVCCSGPTCSATMGIQSVQLTPTAPSTLNLNLRATVQTTQIKYEQYVLLGWVTCNITYNSAQSAPSTVGLLADVNLKINGADGNKLEIPPPTTTLQDFDCGDINISGGVLCTLADWFCPLFKGMIQDKLMGTVNDTVDGMLKSLPMGQEARFDVASFLKAYSPRTTGQVDYFLWGGGYAEAENAGMSFGVMGGFRPAQYSSCVPNCEAAGATCTAPALPAIARSLSFRNNLRPDGKPFDVGIGVDSKALDMAAYAMYASGGLCLDVSSRSVSQLSSGTFGLLVPSIANFTNGKVMPMTISVRPRNPPTVALGKGTYHKDSSGKIVIDDPLLKITAKDFAIDVYLQIDERPVRLFTMIGQLDVPALLFADANGRLQPMLGALDQAFSGVRIENNDLITEDPANLVKLLPTILAVAASFLGSGFDPIELPSIQKLKLLLDSGSITTTDSQKVLAIFANLGMLTTHGKLPVKTSIEEQDLWVPAAEDFRIGPSFRAEHGPRLTLRLGAEVPPALAGHPVEFAYRVDGGFFQPWSSGDRVVISDPLFWLQGEHTVEVMARVQGRPETTGQPTAHRFVIATPRTREAAAPPAGHSAEAISAEQGGCSIGGRGAAGAGALALLGLALLIWRRRRTA